MIAFDETARTLHLSVDDLLDNGPHLAADDEVDPGREQLAADALAHWLDEQAPETYRTRVRVAIEFPWREYRVHLDGVADGIAERGSGLVVDVLRCVPAAGGAERAIERAGLLCLLLYRSKELVHKGRVVELSLLTPGSELLDVAFSVAAYERLLEQRLERIERVSLGVKRRARRRSTNAIDLPFPFETLRPGQELMLRDVDDAAQSGLTLLCSAPTGIGKTVAVLQPLLRRALLEDRKLFFVTSRVSQQTLALETLARMLPPGSDSCAVQISARDRICPTRDLGCLPGRCPLMRGFVQRIDASGVLEDLAALGVADSNAIAVRALDAQLCPFETALELARDASVIVGDFNYVFDPNVYLRRFFDESYAQHLLVVDEAHNLPARAQDYYSPMLELPALSALAGRCESLRSRPYRNVARLLRDVVEHCAQHAQTLASSRGDAPPWVEPPEREFWQQIAPRAAAAALDYTAALAVDGRPAALAPDDGPRQAPRPRDPVRQALGTIRDFCRFSAGDPERTAALWTPESAKLLCLDPSPEIGARIRGFHSAVCMSATLHPPDFYARALGIDSPETVRLDLPSPFPASNRLILCVPSVDTTYRKRNEDAPRIAELIERSIELRPGNYLAFFPSFAYRDEVLKHMTRRAARMLVQIPGMATAPFLRLLERNHSEALLLCGVHGGVFSEGVDYPAHMAIGVFVVGPGLPQVSLERELIREHYDHELGAGFEHAYIAPGMNRVVQAGGRAIRTPTDRAAIVLLGRRFSEPEYRQRMPLWWQEEIVEADDPLPALKAFWEGSGVRPDARGAGG